MSTQSKLLLLIAMATCLHAAGQLQPAEGLTLVPAGKKVIVQYRFPKTEVTEKYTAILYRGDKRNELVKAIYQLDNYDSKADFYVVDSGLTTENYWTYTLDFRRNNRSVISETKGIYNTLPSTRAALTGFEGSVKSGENIVTLKWKIDNNFLASDLTIYRSRDRNDNYSVLKSPDAETTSLTDIADDSNEPFFYKLSFRDKRSGAVTESPIIAIVPEFEIKPQRPQGLRASISEGKASLRWTAEDDNTRGFFVFKRFGLRDKFFSTSGFIPAGSSAVYSWIDSSSSDNNGFAQYIVMAESNSFTKSESSDTVLIEFPQTVSGLFVPADLQIVKSVKDSLRLIWTADSTGNSSGYVVESAAMNSDNFTRVAETISADKNFITVISTAPGTRLRVMSKRESLLSEPSLPLTIYAVQNPVAFGPRNLKGETTEGKVLISWAAQEEGIKEYLLYKRVGKNFVIIARVPSDKSFYETEQYSPGQRNEYYLTALNKDNTESKGSASLVIF